MKSQRTAQNDARKIDSTRTAQARRITRQIKVLRKVKQTLRSGS